jgi:hypothetical protein
MILADDVDAVSLQSRRLPTVIRHIKVVHTTSTIEQSGSDLVDSLVPVGRQTACRHDGVGVYGA